MARVSKEQYEERLADTEQTMVRVRSSYRVEATLAKKYNVDMRTVRKWMRAVRERWRAAAVEVDKDAHRDELAATLNEVIFLAMNRSHVVKNDDGTVVVDSNPNSPTFGKPIVKQNPDLQRVLHGVQQLRSIYGVDAPVGVKVKVSSDVNHLPDFTKLPPEAIGPMEELLKAIAPNGDITALAGDWFTTDDAPTEPTGDK